MKKNTVFTKILVIAGTLLVWLPLVLPLLFAFPRSFAIQRFHFDFLLPMELFPVMLVGGGLLLWAALQARSFVKWIAWSLGATVGLLLVSQGFAVVSGIASGVSEPSGWLWVILFAIIAVFWLAGIALGVGGILLARSLFKGREKPG